MWYLGFPGALFAASKLLGLDDDDPPNWVNSDWV
jgi:hypothetical protein